MLEISILTCCGIKTNGFGPKVVVDVNTVSLLGGWNTEFGPRSASKETPVHKAEQKMVNESKDITSNNSCSFLIEL